MKKIILIFAIAFASSLMIFTKAEALNTDGWHLYNNHSGSHSYSLLFPPDWKVKTFGPDERGFMPERHHEDSPVLKFRDFEGLNYSEVIAYYRTPENSFLDQYDFLFETEDEELVARKAYFADVGTGKTTEKIMIKRGGQITVMSRKREKQEAITEAIINSFKFTDNWKAQINLRENYTFIIPENYSVEKTGTGLNILNMAGNKVVEVEGDEVHDIGMTYITGQIMDGFHFFDITEEGKQPYEYFLDVRENHPNAEAINTLTKKGVVDGYKDGTFKPDDPVNRAEIVTMTIPRIIQKVLPPTIFGNCFDDVENQWFAKSVCFARFMGRIEGYEDGTFRPGESVNRAEGLKIILEASGADISPNEILQRDTVRDISEDAWYRKYFIHADNRDLLDKGHVSREGEEYYYHPSEDMTRKEVAEMIFRIKY